MTRPLRLAIVGAAGRGGHLARLCAAVGGVEVTAVCDIRADALERCRQEAGACEAYTDFTEMLRSSDCEAVLIGTPMHLHAEQSIAALASGRHVLSEVTAAISIDECRRLHAAAKASRAVYSMAENYGYSLECALVSELVRQGAFGEVYYAEGEYLHELKGLIEETPWRRLWQAGLFGITYPTHSLGPVLEWFAGDRVDRLTATDSGSHHRDPRGVPYHHDSASILAKTVQGRQITLRFDLISNRPHGMNRYQLQGTEGCYESGRVDGEPGRLWLSRLHRSCAFQDIGQLLRSREAWERMLPEWYRDGWERARSSGHGGADWFMLKRFVETVRGTIANPCGIDTALDLTLPGLVSQDPAAYDRWLPVPDSRTW